MADLKTVEKTASIFKMAASEEGVTVGDVARRLGLPLATAYRHVGVLEKEGLLRKDAEAVLSPGAWLIAMLNPDRFRTLLTVAARPVLSGLSEDTGAAAHLGVLDDEMVTYLLKAAPGGHDIFTREGGQLEAYCSAVGKMLLAYQKKADLDAYLDGGPFPALTKKTITSKKALKQELLKTKRRGYAVDDGEISDELFCIAAPVRNVSGGIFAAVSVSSSDPAIAHDHRRTTLNKLRVAIDDIRKALFGRGM
ncbi:IclR family transcriptional regulator [Hyphococcus sp.]|uniref:IclR family transcriptional regulator n=1 Tax=Hyphococcus sp. TaxID=2038636 RepID=UPI0035C718FC